jgi:hypothetical protein
MQILYNRKQNSLFSHSTGPRAAARNVDRGLFNVLPAKLCGTLTYVEVLASKSVYVSITVLTKLFEYRAFHNVPRDTNVYNKKTDYLNGAVHSSRKNWKKVFFWQLEMFDVCITGGTAHIDTIFKFLPYTRQHGCIDILHCCNDPYL